MYENTLPLLQQHFEQIASVHFINATKAGFDLVAFYDRLKSKFELLEANCTWFNEKVHPFMNNH